MKQYKLTTSQRALSVLLYWRNENLLLLDPPYQRGDVWGTIRRVNLIRSILIGIPIPSIIINDRNGLNKDYRNAIIDGKQRYTTFLMLFDDKLMIPGEWFGMKGNVKFSDLSSADKASLKYASIGLCIGQGMTEDEEKEVFELVNYGGVKQGESDNE